LGNFGATDKILVIYKSGEYELTNFELTNHYDPRQVHTIAKFNEKRAISCIYYDGEQKNYHIKRFLIETSTLDKKFMFITDHNRSELLMASYDKRPRIEIKFKKQRKSEVEKLLFKVDEMIEVKGWKALGNKLVYDKIIEIKTLDPEADEEDLDDAEVEEIVNSDIEENDEELAIEFENEENIVPEKAELKLPLQQFLTPLPELEPHIVLVLSKTMDSSLVLPIHIQIKDSSHSLSAPISNQRQPF
jgi:topoisomerase-4 subunit A